MKLLEIQTNFRLKGDRNYIHSTSLCDLLAKCWCDFAHEKLQDLTISIDIHEEAKTNGKIIYFDRQHSVKEIGATCEAVIKSNGKVACYCYFVEEQLNIGNEPSPAYDISSFELMSDFSATCLVGVESSLMLLENVIEANKRAHLKSLEEGDYNVLNIYMKEFPFSILNLGGMQRLYLENKRKRFQVGGVATISDLWFEEEPDRKFQISFYARKRPEE